MIENSLTVGQFRKLMELRQCNTRDSLRASWLALSPAERAALRWNPQLAAHARTVLDGDRS